MKKEEIKKLSGKELIENIEKKTFVWLVVFYFSTLFLILYFIFKGLASELPNIPLEKISNVFFIFFSVGFYILFIIFSVYLISRLIQNFKKFVWIYLIVVGITTAILIILGVYHYFEMKGIIYGAGLIFVGIASGFGASFFWNLYKKKI